MDIVLSRILEYLNGCLIDDYMYRIGRYIVAHYTEMKCITIQDLIEEGFYEGDILNFCRHLGFFSYNDFKDKLIMDQQTRLSQISLRMIGTNSDDCLKHLNISVTEDAFKRLIDEVVEVIFKNNRVIIVGDLYPNSIAVELQTDLISLGKDVMMFHHFDNDFQFKEDDVVFFLTATGRTFRNNAMKMRAKGLCDAYIVLVTQNKKYEQFEEICADYIIHVLGKFDGIEFNHQLMYIFDMLRIRYYQKYYM